MSKQAKPAKPEDKKPARLIEGMDEDPNRSGAQRRAEVGMSATIRHAAAAQMWGDDFTGMAAKGKPSDLDECIRIVADRAHDVRDGGVDVLTDTLVAQMASLDTLFSAMMNRAGRNIGTYPDAAERYMNLALKAQANCRVTAETIARIKRDGKQTVKVVHVHEGGQAVVADTVNNQTGPQLGGHRGPSAENVKQSHEQAADAVVAALPGPDPERDGVPLPSFERQEAVPIARGSGGSAEGQPERVEARRPIG